MFSLPLILGADLSYLAIGHSTNLISQDANIIVIRGNRDGFPVYQQMVNAAEEFFPESNLLKDPDPPSPLNPPDIEQQFPLRRVDTGLSSIVGTGNGDRPGGFVLVVDGAALEHVCRFPLLLRSRVQMADYISGLLLGTF